MKHDFYTFPLRFDTLMTPGARLETCDLAASVQQHIFLILLTRFGENHFDENYGSEVWEFDFHNVKELDGKKHDFENSLKNLLLKQEPRLTQPMVTIIVTQEEVISNRFTQFRQMKKKIQIKVKGRLIHTNQEFDPPPYVIYFSPVSITHQKRGR